MFGTVAAISIVPSMRLDSRVFASTALRKLPLKVHFTLNGY
jgi:hypothetical protein